MIGRGVPPGMARADELSRDLPPLGVDGQHWMEPEGPLERASGVLFCLSGR